MNYLVFVTTHGSYNTTMPQQSPILEKSDSRLIILLYFIQTNAMESYVSEGHIAL